MSHKNSDLGTLLLTLSWQLGLCSGGSQEGPSRSDGYQKGNQSSVSKHASGLDRNVVRLSDDDAGNGSWEMTPSLSPGSLVSAFMNLGVSRKTGWPVEVGARRPPAEPCSLCLFHPFISLASNVSPCGTTTGTQEGRKLPGAWAHLWTSGLLFTEASYFLEASWVWLQTLKSPSCHSEVPSSPSFGRRRRGR